MHSYEQKKVGVMTNVGHGIMAEMLFGSGSSSHTHYANKYEELISINLKRDEVNIYAISKTGALSHKEKGCSVGWSEKYVTFELDCENAQNITFNISRAELTGTSFRQRREKFSEGADMIYTYKGQLQCEIGLPRVIENKF